MKSNCWQRVLAIAIPYFLIVGLFTYAGMLICGISIEEKDPSNTLFQDLIIFIFSTLGTVFVVALFVKYIDKETIVKGLKMDKRIKFRGFIISGVCVLLVLVLVFLLLNIYNEIIFLNFDFDWVKLLASLLLFVLIAISEEFLMRGYVLKNFLQSFSLEIALIISSILFALLHVFNSNLSWTGLSNLFLAGILLGLIYVLTDSIWYPTIVHFFWNFFQTHLGFNISGKDSYSVINIGINNENIFNGGQFGLEGSILTLILLIIVSIILYSFVKKNPFLLSTQ